MKKILAWHFVKDDKKLKYEGGLGLEVAPGYIYTEDSPQLELCSTGLHASIKLRDALVHAPGLYLCRVSMWGDVIQGDDKLVARNRQVLAAADVTADIRLWTCWCVRQQWHLLTDPRSRNAVEVLERYAVGQATDKELSAASDAASAAHSKASIAAYYTYTAHDHAASAAAYASYCALQVIDGHTAKYSNAAAISAANAAAYAGKRAEAVIAQDNELERRMLLKLGLEK